LGSAAQMISGLSVAFSIYRWLIYFTFISMLAIGYGHYPSKHAWQRILHFMVTHFRPDSDYGNHNWD
jgi:hypothetical protein